MAMSGKTVAAAAKAITDRRAFHTSTGNLQGVAFDGVDGRYMEAGWLSDTERDALRQATRIDYVVLSYATPLAWHSEAGWHYVNQSFSPTTQNHQHTVRMALNGEWVVTERGPRGGVKAQEWRVAN